LERPLRPLDGEILSAVIFSLKTFSAALLALFLGFWLGLDQPKWALLTVFVVSQPNSRLVRMYFKIVVAVERLTECGYQSDA
jgi:hypothetical protein